MLTLGGLGFVFACVFGSYMLSGGSMEPLIEAIPFEMLTIGGAAIGTFVMSNSMHDVKHTLGGFRKILKGALLQAGRLRRPAEPALFLRAAGQHEGLHGARAAYREAGGERRLPEIPEDPRRTTTRPR